MADRPHPTSIAGGPYDGTTFSYIPGPTLDIDPSLTLHREWTDKIDPITYEVIRHNLWNINEELGMTIQRISGSPVAMYAFDLNSSIFTEDGEFIYYGPYQLYMSGVSDVQVKWTLEHRSKNPGIHEDDMFLSNDPWVGAAHQMDVTLLSPVFHEGKLFCWITNVLHQYDVRHHAGLVLPQRARLVRRGHPDPARQDRGARRAAQGHRGRLPALVAQAVPGGAGPARPDRRQQHGQETNLGAGAAVRRRRRQGRHGQEHRQRRAGLRREAGQGAGRHLARALVRGGRLRRR